MLNPASKKLCTLFLFAIAWCLAPAANSAAEIPEAVEITDNGSKTFGDYTVYFSVFNSSFLRPEVAKNLQLTRGKNHAVVNISVRKNLADGQDTEQAATVTGKTTDLVQEQSLDFQEVREQGAIYYLAEMTFDDADRRNFFIAVQVDGEHQPMTIKFTRTLYHDK